MSANDPVTWQLALVIQSQLQKVTKANGYYTDIGNNVVVEETQQDADVVSNAVVVEVSRTVRSEDTQAHRRQRQATFTVQAGLSAGMDNAMQTAHQIVADIEKVLDQQAAYAPIGVRMAKATESEIVKRPDGMDAIIVQVTGYANYLPQ